MKHALENALLGWYQIEIKNLEGVSNKGLIFSIAA